MKIEFIGHASILAETNGIRILSDPWWRGPCFGAQWWNRPEPVVDRIDGPLDYVYISHGHEDHYHPGTLKTLPGETKMLVSSGLDLADPLRELGFEVIEVEPDSPTKLDDKTSVWIWGTHGGDTLFVLDDGEEVLVNLNDALHSATREVQDFHVAKLKERFPTIDYVFCGYGIASHFPNCYLIPGKNDQKTAAKRQQYFNAQWAYLMHELAPRCGFPFAANVVLFEDDLIDMNEAVHNSERPTERFQAIYGGGDSRLIDIAPGFRIVNGEVADDCCFEPTDMKALRARDEEAYSRANRYSAPEPQEVEQIAQLIEANIAMCRDYLLEHRADYLFGVCFRGSDQGILITRTGSSFRVEQALQEQIQERQCDVTFSTRAVYLRRSLTEEYADEVLFVGSGGVFRYRTREGADSNVHQELMVMLRKHSACPTSRFGDNPRWLFNVKRLLKRALGRMPEDLYDLNEWIVYD